MNKNLLDFTILFGLTVTAIANSSTEGLKGANIEVAAFESKLDIGDVYTELRGLVIFDDKIHDGYVNKTDIKSTKIDYARNDTLFEKMKKLDLQPQDVVEYFTRYEESYKPPYAYLTTAKMCMNSVKMSLIYKIRTGREQLEIRPNMLKNITKCDTLECFDRFPDTTHVVVGIEKGLDIILSLEESAPDPAKATQIERKFEDALKTVADLVNTTEEIGSRFSHLEENSNNVWVELRSFKFYRRSILRSMDFRFIVSTIRMILNAAKDESTDIVRNIKYTLMPISKLMEDLGIKNVKSEFKELKPEIANELVEVFQNHTDSRVMFGDVYHGITMWPNIFTQSEDNKIRDIRENFKRNQARWKNHLKEIYPSVASVQRRRLSEDALRSLISEYTNSNWTLERFKDTMMPILRKTEWLHRLCSAKASFIKSDTGKSDILEMNSQGDEEIRIISGNFMGTQIENYIDDMVKLLNVELAKKAGAVKYYMEQGDEIPIPKVEAYRYGDKINTFLIKKKE